MTVEAVYSITGAGWAYSKTTGGTSTTDAVMTTGGADTAVRTKDKACGACQKKRSWALEDVLDMDYEDCRNEGWARYFYTARASGCHLVHHPHHHRRSASRHKRLASGMNLWVKIRAGVFVRLEDADFVLVHPMPILMISQWRQEETS